MSRKRCQLLPVKQWLTTWDMATWEDGKNKPPRQFYIGSISLKALRALSGVRTRTIDDRKNNADGTGYQRTHDDERLNKIGRYIQYGFPLSTANGLLPDEHKELINPGWLPTAILINIIGATSSRPKKGHERYVETINQVKIISDSESYFLDYPINDFIDPEIYLPPLEIIDGQHRLLATDSIKNLDEEYEVPIVVFENLALNWQAYLFWVINVEPKRINTSLAFDLYPDLRDQTWLQRGESVKIYQEHRSQELAEVLWRHNQSPWLDRIELFGKRVAGHVSNAAVIRSLMSTFVRPWGKTTGDGDEIINLGGLFGSIDRMGKSYVLRWKRPEQAAFLLLCWITIRDAVSNSKAEWKELLDNISKNEIPKNKDVAFSGQYTLLATDQGFRSICFTFNAIAQLECERIGLFEIESDEGESEPTDTAVTRALKMFIDNKKIVEHLIQISTALIQNVDWRTSSAPGLSRAQQEKQSQYRGSSGYRALSRESLIATTKSNSEVVKNGAEMALKILGWSDE